MNPATALLPKSLLIVFVYVSFSRVRGEGKNLLVQEHTSNQDLERCCVGCVTCVNKEALGRGGSKVPP